MSRNVKQSPSKPPAKVAQVERMKIETMKAENKAEDAPMEEDITVTARPLVVLFKKLGYKSNYELIGESDGKDPNFPRSFTMKTVVEGKEFIGEGKSKRLATVNAAAKAIEEVFGIKYDPDLPVVSKKLKRKRDATDEFIPVGDTGFREHIPGDPETEAKRVYLAKQQVRSALKRLNELRSGLLQWTCEVQGEKRKTYKQTVVVDGKSYSSGQVKSKKEAANDAAMLALKDIEPNFREGEVKQKGIGKNYQYDGKFLVTGAHPRLLLNQKLGTPCQPELVSTMGQEMTMKLVVKGKEYYATAIGKKKAATQVAERVLLDLFNIKYNPLLAIKNPPKKKAEAESPKKETPMDTN